MGSDTIGPPAPRLDAPQTRGPGARTAVPARGTFSGRSVHAGEATAPGLQSARHRRPVAEPGENRRSLLSRAISVLTSPFRTIAPIRSRAQAATASPAPSAPNATPSEGPRRRVGERQDLATGHVTRLANLLVNFSAAGAIPTALEEELKSAVTIAGQVDADILRAVELLDKSAVAPLGDEERRELASLVASNRHNLVLLQSWAGQRAAGLGGEEMTPHAQGLYEMLQKRFADRLMDLADLICLHDLEEPRDEPVSRSARAGACLLHADAALDVARTLDVQGLDHAAKTRLLDELQVHRDRLAEVRDVSSGRMEPPTSELRLAARELWDAPLPLVKPGKAGADGLQDLKARWGGGGAPLPLAHPQVGQARMLREFIEFRLGQAGVAAGDMPDLRSVQDEAYNRAVNAQPWEPVETQVRTRLPGGAAPTAVESRIVPGKAMAAHFPMDYPANGINCSDRTQYAHVPNLARTSLTNAHGEVLFAGLRHGVVDPYDIDAKFLARLPDARLKTMIGDLLVRDAAGTADGEDRSRRIDDLAARIRSDPGAAAEAARAMRAQASNGMARELATAALVADPEKFERACAGETVELNLSSISLLTPDLLRHAFGKAGSDERTMLRHQTAAFENLARGNPVELPVRDAAGRPRTVRAIIGVRQFNFGVNAGAVQGFRIGPASIPARAPGVRHLMGWGFAMANNDPHLNRLVGPADRPGLGGDVEARVLSMSARARRLREQRDALVAGLEGAGSGQPEAAASQAEITRLSGQVEGLEKNTRTLVEAANQLKTVWASREYRHGGGDPYKMVSRLALVSHLMGETPLFNCKSGKDRTGQLDAEVKFLATAADERDGRLPGVDQDMASWRAARGDFTLHTGNLEMQQLNTGLPGYKLAGVAGLANMVADGMKPVYRGGSAYIAS